MNTKLCRTCGTIKHCSEFHIRAASKDGLSAKCKSCASEYDKKRANLPHRVAARKAYQQSDRGRAASNRAKRKYIETNPKKRAAHIAVGNALRDGLLIRGNCEVCGNSNTEAHHCDYNSPLSVMWLCDTHHKAWHKVNKPKI